ncbi:MAG: tetratricopeptide repeat protein [Vicinamibacterales bacterium]
MKARQALGQTLAVWALVLSSNGAIAAQETPSGGAQKTADAPLSLIELDAAIKNRPGDPRLHVALGLAYWNQNDYARALEAFQRAVDVGPDSAEAHNWLGVALSEKADLPGAIALFRKAIALDPGYGRAYTNLGSTLATTGDFAEAVEVFQTALTLEPNSLAAQMNLGMALREKGDVEQALQYLRRVASNDPNNANTQYELGQTLRQSGDLPGAVAAFEQTLELQPEMREAYYALGMVLKEQSAEARKPLPMTDSPADDLYTRARTAAGRGELSAARDQLTEALRADDEHADSHNLIGFILGQQGDLPSARAHLERAVALRPDSAEAHYNLGVALWSSGARDEALPELRQSVTLDPAAGASYAFLGTALRESGDLAGARATLQRAIALLPPTAAVYIDLGITFLRAGDLGKALGQFEAGLNVTTPSLPAPDWERAIAALREVRPGSDQGQTAVRPTAETHNVLGLLLGRSGVSTDDVAAEFREAIRLRPDFAEAHNNLGLVLIQAGDDQAGIATLREAVRLRPDYADAHANLGAALTPTAADEAIVELDKAVALAPMSVNALFNRAVAYGASARHGVAKEIEQLRTVIELAPTFARARLALGKALLRDGKPADAIAELEEGARLEPNSGEAHYQLGLALARAGRKEEAAAALRKGRDLVAADDRSQNAKLEIAEGRAALERGDLERATAKLRRAIQLMPESAEAQRYLGVVLEKRNDTEGASAAYRKALELDPADLSAKQALEKLMNAATGADDAARVAELEAYVRQEKYEQVEPLLGDYVKERPTSSWGWYALGYSLFAQQKIGESIKALAKSLELDIRNAEAHKILGRNLMIIGRFDAAQVEFEQGIRYKPDSAEMHYNLGKLFSIQDNWEPARKAFESAVRLDPSYIEAVDALGFALEALGDDAGAVEKYEQAIALNAARQGTFASAHVNLSAYYNRTGNPDKALELARQAIDLDQRSDRAWFQKARADERQGRLEEAVEALNRAIVINPRASSYYYVLAGVYRRLDWMDDSRKALEVFKRLERDSSELDKKRRGNTSSPETPSGRKRE